MQQRISEILDDWLEILMKIALVSLLLLAITAFGGVIALSFYIVFGGSQ